MSLLRAIWGWLVAIGGAPALRDHLALVTAQRDECRLKAADLERKVVALEAANIQLSVANGDLAKQVENIQKTIALPHAIEIIHTGGLRREHLDGL